MKFYEATELRQTIQRNIGPGYKASAYSYWADGKIRSILFRLTYKGSDYSIEAVFYHADEYIEFFNDESYMFETVGGIKRPFMKFARFFHLLNLLGGK